MQIINQSHSLLMFVCEGNHILFVGFRVVLEQNQRLLLGGAIEIWLILQQFLNSQQNLFHSQMWLPVLFVVQN